MKYYKVTAMRGHMGIGKGTEITFVFQARDLMAAVGMAKKMPAVKHTRMVCYGAEITKEEYELRIQRSAYHFYG